jgi:hypothetical protein
MERDFASGAKQDFCFGLGVADAYRSAMETLELDKIDRAIFAPWVGQAFEMVFRDGRVPLTLVEARSLGTARPGTARDPFALTFQGPPNLRLPQGICRIEHATLGAMEIFVVQLSADSRSSQFEAIFN